jgi:cytosine/adenosine deaminase-related metal-dependent hydrolase
MQSDQSFKITNAWICQVSGARIVPAFGDLEIADGKIRTIKAKDFRNFSSKNTSAQEPDINAGGRAITLPLINFHEHIYSRLAKGLPVTGSMADFPAILQNLWWKMDALLDREMIRASAQLAALESIRNGVTCLFDHHASPGYVNGSLNTLAEILSGYGLRGVLCFETSDRHGPEIVEQAMEENIGFIDKNSHGEIKGMFGLHAAFTLSDSSLHKVSVLLRRRQAGIHIHLAEDRHDRDACLKQYGITPAARLQKFGLLNPQSITAHGVHLAAEDYRILNDSGAALVYNPDSNLNNAVGLPQYGQAPDTLPILAGSDGMHANAARSLKQLFLQFRAQGASFNAAFSWLIKIYFDQLKFARRYFPDFPALLEGDRADFIVWDYIPPTPFTTDNFWGHFIYGILEQPVHSVVQNGRLLLNNGRFSFNCDGVIDEITLQGRRLYEKFS